MRTPPMALRRAVSALLLPTVLVLAVPPPARALPPGNGKLQIIHLNAAQGDAAVLISPLGQVAMFDDGSNTSFCSDCPSCATVLAELQSLGVSHVALHFASHYHADHIGCITSLSGVTIDQGWDRAQSYSTATYTNYVSYLGGKRHTLTKGMTFTLDSLSAHPVTITCVALAGDGISTSDENSLSVVMKVSYGEFDEEIGGDLEGSTVGGGVDVETKVGPQVGKVEVYKVHHHCSAYSTNDNWLNATQPKIAIVPVGNGNPYGHPVASTLGRLHAHGVRTYWTETGAGAAPDPQWDKVAGGMVRIEATWEPGGVDSVFCGAVADTFTNNGARSVDGVPPVVASLAPNGGETVAAGAPASVTWSASDNVGVTSVKLDYSVNDGVSWHAIATGLPNTGSAPWNVPNSPSVMTLVRATAFDAAGNSGSRASAGDFTIADQTSPTVSVTSPNGGESWPEGSTQSVTWTAGDNVGVQSVDVDYSEHGPTGPWLAAQHGLANTGSYGWTILNASGDSMLVRLTVYDAAGNQGSDASNGIFQVTSGPLGVPAALALRFALAPAHPNPSSGGVAARFTLALAAPTTLEVLDVSGRRVWGTSPAAMDPGEHTLAWNGRDDRGESAALGLYFLRLTSGPNVAVARFVLVR